jgi:hypothetical protein
LETVRKGGMGEDETVRRRRGMRGGDDEDRRGMGGRRRGEVETMRRRRGMEGWRGGGEEEERGWRGGGRPIRRKIRFVLSDTPVQESSTMHLNSFPSCHNFQDLGDLYGDNISDYLRQKYIARNILEL